jgi:hypothetical protein
MIPLHKVICLPVSLTFILLLYPLYPFNIIQVFCTLDILMSPTRCTYSPFCYYHNYVLLLVFTSFISPSELSSVHLHVCTLTLSMCTTLSNHPRVINKSSFSPVLFLILFLSAIQTHSTTDMSIHMPAAKAQFNQCFLLQCYLI